jgi:hypothetical protein
MPDAVICEPVRAPGGLPGRKAMCTGGSLATVSGAVR